MRQIPASLLTTVGLIGGFAVARISGHRPLSGVFAGGAGIAALELARRRAGPGNAGALGAVYLGSLVVSHPLAKKLGAWPSVLAVSACTALAAHRLADRPAHRRR